MSKNSRKVVSVNMDTEDIDALMKKEKTTGLGFQSMVRQAVKNYLKKSEEKAPKNTPVVTPVNTLSETELLNTYPSY